MNNENRKRTLEEMIRIQFNKGFYKGYLKNAEFENNNCDYQGNLLTSEKCIVKFCSRDNFVYHITNKRILRYRIMLEEVVCFAEVEKISLYISKIAIELLNSKDSIKTFLDMKQKYGDSIVITKTNGSELVLHNLASSTTPLYDALSWYKRIYGGAWDI